MSQNLLEKIKSRITNQLKNVKTPPIAVFDADGTLWAEDVGRGFFQYQVQNKLLNIPNPQDQFNNITLNKGRKKALQWLACIQAGTPFKKMQKMVNDFLTNHHPQAFLFQQQLIKWLKKNQVQIFVVSSSLKWVLNSALKVYNLKAHHIIGVETIIKNNCLSDTLITPAPIGEDKVSALKKISPHPPLFCAGNTLSDQYLLEWSSSKLAVTTAQKGEKNYLSEQQLLKIAKQKNWFYFNPANKSSL